jgi:hypothetical protein
MKTAHAAVLALTLAALAAGVPARAQRGDVGPVTDELYLKECGGCHMAYSPGLLPERSWRRIMSGLTNHFGDNAELKAPERDRILAYLTRNAADLGASWRSRAILASIPAGETPTRITKTPHIDGIHGGLLDPIFKGRPQVKSLAECAACHPKAPQGSFGERRYIITDEVFRRPE